MMKKARQPLTISQWNIRRFSLKASAKRRGQTNIEIIKTVQFENKKRGNTTSTQFNTDMSDVRVPHPCPPIDPRPQRMAVRDRMSCRAVRAVEGTQGGGPTAPQPPPANVTEKK